MAGVQLEHAALGEDLAELRHRAGQGRVDVPVPQGDGDDAVVGVHPRLRQSAVRHVVPDYP